MSYKNTLLDRCSLERYGCLFHVERIDETNMNSIKAIRREEVRATKGYPEKQDVGRGASEERLKH